MSCGEERTPVKSIRERHEKQEGHARRFSISAQTDHTLVCLFGNRSNFDTTSKFVLYKNEPPRHVQGTAIKVPVNKIAALSSIYASMLCEVGAEQSIMAIDNIDYVNNKSILSMFEKGMIREFARGPEIDAEAAITNPPDIIFSFGMGDGVSASEKKISQAGIPIAVSVDHLEESPLARAEWIKFFAIFADKLAKADSIFRSVEQHYLALKAQTKKAANKPTVFSEVKYGDVWYMPGGNSYMACLMRDAGADYLWKDREQSGSIPLSFEQVYERAKNADYWINLPLIRSKKELLEQDRRYGKFEAFRANHIYNNTRVVNSKGYSTYWESGMIHPEQILHDLSIIFHPDAAKDHEESFYFYELLQ
jgi:iron complex transport system substrate-binding protein